MAAQRAQRIVLAAIAASAAAVLGAAGHQGYLERCYHALRLRAAADYFEELLPAEEGTEADRALESFLHTPAGRARAIEAFVEWLAGDFEPHWKKNGLIRCRAIDTRSSAR